MTTIKLSDKTRDKLKDSGRKGDRYEDIILQLIKCRENKSRSS